MKTIKNRQGVSMKGHGVGSIIAALAMIMALCGAAMSPAIAGEAGGEMAASGEVIRVDINTADAATLAEKLKGVGPTKAKAIVQWREQNGEFKSVDQLTQVKGIGDATLDDNRQRLAL